MCYLVSINFQGCDHQQEVDVIKTCPMSQDQKRKITVLLKDIVKKFLVLSKRHASCILKQYSDLLSII